MFLRIVNTDGSGTDNRIYWTLWHSARYDYTFHLLYVHTSVCNHIFAAVS
jgi:hypothetical protein